MPEKNPRIRIVNTSGMAHDTQVFTANGTEISSAIQEIHLHMEVGKMNTAEVKAILIGTEVDAVITDLQTKVLPPPAPKVQYRFNVDALGFWELRRLTPLPTYGVEEEILASGMVAKSQVGLGPLEFTGE